MRSGGHRLQPRAGVPRGRELLRRYLLCAPRRREQLWRLRAHLRAPGRRVPEQPVPLRRGPRLRRGPGLLRRRMRRLRVRPGELRRLRHSLLGDPGMHRRSVRRAAVHAAVRGGRDLQHRDGDLRVRGRSRLRGWRHLLRHRMCRHPDRLGELRRLRHRLRGRAGLQRRHVRRAVVHPGVRTRRDLRRRDLHVRGQPVLRRGARLLRQQLHRHADQHQPLRGLRECLRSRPELLWG